MGSYENHSELYKKFKTDATNISLFEGTRVEAYFLSAFHLIEACASKKRVHINKHQSVRRVLEDNLFIFDEDTETVWRAFQTIENQIRPKFAYGFSWTKDDFKEIVHQYSIIEECCRKVIGK